MQRYSLEEILDFIKQGEVFAGQLSSSGCYIKIEQYLPVVCTAIHTGHELREDRLKYCLLTAEERDSHEARLTYELIASQPITLSSLDSRLEYDLDYPKALSTSYKLMTEQALWKRPLSATQRLISHNKHDAFFQIYTALITKLESLFGKVIVFDIKAYTPQEADTSAPLFDISTTQIDMSRWQSVVNKFHSELTKTSVPNMDTSVALNVISRGMGYLTTHTNAHFDRTLVLAIHIKKVYLDAQNGDVFPLVVDALKLGLKQSLSETSAFFQRKINQKNKVCGANMLSSAIEPAVLNVDALIYKLAQGVETLKYVNPVNLTMERHRFERAPSRFKPNFHYRQLPIDANAFKYNLYRVPIESILDPAMKQLYSDMIHSLSEQIDLLSSVGQEAFLYNSLRHYGRPDAQSINNAKFLLYAKEIEENSGEILDAKSACELMKQQASDWGMKCKVNLSSSILARAMVSSTPPQLKVNTHAKFSYAEVQRLNHHELGVHMATTLNARHQALKALRLGLPGATETQEGLAIMAEYNAGYMAHNRLNTLAYRVLAVDSMLKEQNFYQTYSYLVDELGMKEDDAFVTTTRVYRGGGLTKDHLYLSGFVTIKQLSAERDLTNLMIGKTGSQYLDLIDELVQRNWLTPPKFVIHNQQNNDSEIHNISDIEANKTSSLSYLIESLRG
ncbi:flavohemoglobin expression-modulating QEGLA motif protein [Shewanella sp. D64]|uniref:flavohemoglobin expression-modulating QEGLA motif protein n=1 Tax=unclassified Shewanella TaxID=196818 RepID=UPI0022BA6976|nr:MULTISPECIES: flavohemoglobin expression-modulating QEGLA motif protein [unclassified Shewanella]MEC4728516.1 flavohemoglobin expression-modulating QEGLA motif protein [Shewanella sp. D64]MEC4740305.1 flavohemoglobin expression-modulating QEGLA motif protein [Shewanella sp. E94]WBJ94283.1 flavohemoglobin expression-modulating QEGLA motif protein [Shewanella sp. MTB7]